MLGKPIETFKSTFWDWSRSKESFCWWVQMHERFNNSGPRSKFIYKKRISVRYSKYKKNVAGSCRFQIHLCILGCVMSREFTRETVMKFLPPHFPLIWCKSLRRNFFHSKIFNLTKYRDVLVEKFTPHYARRNANLNLTLVYTGTTKGILF